MIGKSSVTAMSYDAGPYGFMCVCVSVTYIMKLTLFFITLCMVTFLIKVKQNFIVLLYNV